MGSFHARLSFAFLSIFSKRRLSNSFVFEVFDEVGVFDEG
jgi:hypothetical protein